MNVFYEISVISKICMMSFRLNLSQIGSFKTLKKNGRLSNTQKRHGRLPMWVLWKFIHPICWILLRNPGWPRIEGKHNRNRCRQSNHFPVFKKYLSKNSLTKPPVNPLTKIAKNQKKLKNFLPKNLKLERTLSPLPIFSTTFSDAADFFLRKFLRCLGEI